MTNEKKCFLDYSSDNGIVGFRLLIENNQDNKITFFTLNEKKEPTVFASIFMAAKEVKSSSLVVRDQHNGLDFFLPNGDILFISYVEAPKFDLDPDDEDAPEKVSAMPIPKPEPIHHFIFLSLIPTLESKARGRLRLPTLIIHRDALIATKGDLVITNRLRSFLENDPEKTFPWGTTVSVNLEKATLFGWMTGKEAEGMLDCSGTYFTDLTCQLRLKYYPDEAFREETAEVFALGLFDNLKSALEQGTQAMIHLNQRNG